MKISTKSILMFTSLKLVKIQKLMINIT